MMISDSEWMDHALTDWALRVKACQYCGPDDCCYIHYEELKIIQKGKKAQPAPDTED